MVFIVAILPGPKVKGLPVPSENNLQYTCKCNALASWFLTLALVAVFHLTRIFRLRILANQFSPMLCVVVTSSDILSIWIHFYALKTNQTC